MSIEQQIKQYICDNILFSDGEYDYADDDSFLEEGIVDSTAVLDLVMFVEESFGLTVDDEEITRDNFDSVSKLANFVRSKQG